MYRTIVGIDGMMCNMCEEHVSSALKRALGLSKVSASHKRNQAVLISAEPLAEREIREALKPTGYKVLSFSSESWEEPSLWQKICRLWK